MTGKTIVNVEICIWKALPAKIKTRDLEREARLIAKNEYDVMLSHNKFHVGMNNLKKENLVSYEEGDDKSKYYLINPKASKNKIKLLELVSDEYRVIKTIRNEARDMEIELKISEEESDEDKKRIQLMINNRKKMLLARLNWLTLIETEGDCPAFLKNDIAIQKDHAVIALREIHEALKKMDERLASQSSATLWSIALKEIEKIDEEHKKLLDEFSN